MYSVLYIATVHFTTIVTETHFWLNLVIVHNHYPSACKTSSTFSPCFSPLARWGQIECQNLCQIECQKKCQIECQNIRQIECQKDYQNICQIECQKECQNNMSGWGSLQVKWFSTDLWRRVAVSEDSSWLTSNADKGLRSVSPWSPDIRRRCAKGGTGAVHRLSATFSTLAGESHMQGAAGNQSLPHTLNWSKVFKKFF